MLKTYKYELAPTAEQAKALDLAMGHVRFIYNLALETRIQCYAKGVNVNVFELLRQLTDLKQGCPWLYKTPNHCLQHAIKNLERAFIRFYKKTSGFPKFKKRNSKQSFHIPEKTKVDFDTNRISLPIFKWIRFHNSRRFSGTVRNSTVSKTTTGRYFIFLVVETGTEIPTKKAVVEQTTVGIDVGLKDFATLSDGQVIANPRFLRRALANLRVQQRTMKRRYKRGAREQSKNYEKQRRIVARLHEKIANQRKDFLDKTSTAITKQYDTICVEDLNIEGMMKNRKLSKSIKDAGWGLFKTMLIYKCQWYGKNLLEIGRFEPSSKTCSSCGAHKGELSLSERDWTCKTCNTTHDRDLNAAVNIKSFGLRAQPLSVNATH